MESATDPHRLGRSFLAKRFAHPDGPTLRYWQDTWLEWFDGRYVEVPQNDLLVEVGKHVKTDLDQLAQRLERTPKQVTPALVTRVLFALKTLVAVPRHVERPLVWLGPGSHTWFAFRNGLVEERAVLELRADRRTPTPLWFSMTCFPFNYEPKATAPRWEAFLCEVLPEQADRDLLQEIFGYLLTPDVSHHKFFLFEGRGANGKGVVVKVLTEMLSRENVSHVPIEVFGERFQLGPTVGKLANISNEINSVRGIAEGVLKEFVAGDRMTIDRKHREPINIIPTARVVITTNLLPEFKDVSEGIRRRMVPLTFGVTIAEAKRDALLSEKLLVELPGIFNWAVRGLARLRNRRFFALPESSHMLLEMMQPEVSSAQQFFESHVEEAPGAFTATDDLYQGYKAWFESQSGSVVVSKTRFGQQLQWAWPAAKKGREGGGGRRWGYVGIRLKPVSQASTTSELSADFLNAILQKARSKGEGKAPDVSDGQDEPAKAAA